MKNFNIYEHDDEPTQAVKVGWSWPGFFFTWLWAFVKKMPGLGIGLLLLFIITGAYAEDSEGLSSIIPLAISIWLGLSGNKQREADLTKKGYKHVAEITAKRPKRALELWLDAEPEPIESEVPSSRFQVPGP